MTPLAGIAAALLAAGVTVAAPSAGATTLPEDGVLEQRLERFCERAPRLGERGEKLRVRLAADAETRGSLAWLKTRVAAAEKDDRDRRAERLQRRLERRTDLAAKLPERLERLKAARQECADAGLGT